uniref:Protein YIPF n=1 Tax=Mucochytrium quahogii TaxID=96639 RepID=A0A7S2W618_9STRA|mmetsp:Transcript_42844/g.68854  ORF Transcript_42844/g.68854 Transcript_42844/m.68854 type:complete len:332 (+) Transcript_42844:329-1324(+)
MMSSPDANPFADDTTFDDVNLLGSGHDGSGLMVDSGNVTSNSDLVDVFGVDDQVIGAQTTSGGMIGGTMSSPRATMQAPQLLSSSGEEQESKGGGMRSKYCAFLSVEYYHDYFNVTTEDVINRLTCVATPWKRNFFEVCDGRPDLYGPFWGSTTLIFLIVATANFSKYMSTTDDQWEHDLGQLSFTAMLVYGFAVAMPFVAWGVFSYLGVSTSNIAFSELACVYGYSFSAFLPASLLCLIPHNSVSWLALLTALGFSAAFLMMNLWERLGTTAGGYLPPMQVDGENGQSEPSLVTEKPSRQTAAIFLVGLLGLHIVFALVLKIKFFVQPSL